MEIGVLIVLMGVLVFAAHFFAWLFSHTQVPDALLLMVVGLLLGPITGLLSADYLGEAGELMVTIVLVVLLFQSGLGLRFSALKEAWRSTVLLSTVSFLATMSMVGSVMWLLFRVDPLIAFTVGSIVGGTSSAVVIPMLRQLKLAEESRTTLLLESVFSDVLTIVITIALLEAHRSGTFWLPAISVKIVTSFFGAAVFGVAFALVWSRLLQLVRHMKNSIFTTPALVFILFGLTESFGFSGPIAALAFGVVMGNVAQMNANLEKKSLFLRYFFMAHSLSKREKVFFSEVVFLLQTFFFVFVGFSIRFSGIEPVILGLSMVILMALIRVLVVKIVAPNSTTFHDAKVMSVMVPKGLAAAALASLPLQRGVSGGELIQETTYAIVLFSVILTSLLVFVINKRGASSFYEALLSGFIKEREEITSTNEKT